MKKLTLEFTVEELSALTDMASNQLFRKQFIDPKMPGYRCNPDDVRLGKHLVERLRLKADGEKKTHPPRRNGVGA